MQGWKSFIPTAQKIEYINALLQVGFDTIDFGSFVSPKWIPQMADTREVIAGLNMAGSRSNLLAIVANLRGAEEACAFNEVTDLGYPFSVSETFQQQNTNRSIGQSLVLVDSLQQLCVQRNKSLVVYLSMGFGNPYGDPYSEDQVLKTAEQITGMGIRIISLADTVGMATPEQVYSTTRLLINELQDVEVGVHLHSDPNHLLPKINAALLAGCTRFDGALLGVGGCPMAGDELVGNLPTELLIRNFEETNSMLPVNQEALAYCLRLATDIFRPLGKHNHDGNSGMP